MSMQQLSIFLENKTGRLTEVLEVLGNESIEIAAMSVADTSEYGILRLIVSNPDEAHLLLKEKGFSANLTDVLAVALPSTAGAFASVLKHFSAENVGIEYVYAFSFEHTAVLIIRPANNKKALEVAEKYELRLVTWNEIFN